jgi:hypothetical protein
VFAFPVESLVPRRNGAPVPLVETVRDNEVIFVNNDGMCFFFIKKWRVCFVFAIHYLCFQLQVVVFFNAMVTV